MTTATAERIVPEQVIEGQVWEGLGKQWHVRVKVAGHYEYTTIVLKKGQSLADRVRDTRRKFRPVAA